MGQSHSANSPLSGRGSLRGDPPAASLHSLLAFTKQTLTSMVMMKEKLNYYLGQVYYNILSPAQMILTGLRFKHECIHYLFSSHLIRFYK